MIARRIVRGVLWGVVVGVGLALGLLLGGRIQDIGVDGGMATTVGLIGGAVAAAAGVAAPMRPKPDAEADSAAPPPGETTVDLDADRVVDLRRPAEPVLDVTAPAPARRPRPLRPRTPSE